MISLACFAAFFFVFVHRVLGYSWLSCLVPDISDGHLGATWRRVMDLTLSWWFQEHQAKIASAESKEFGGILLLYDGGG